MYMHTQVQNLSLGDVMFVARPRKSIFPGALAPVRALHTKSIDIAPHTTTSAFAVSVNEFCDMLIVLYWSSPAI